MPIGTRLALEGHAWKEVSLRRDVDSEPVGRDRFEDYEPDQYRTDPPASVPTN